MQLKNILKNLKDLDLRNISHTFGLAMPAELTYSTKEAAKRQIKESTSGAVSAAEFLSYRYFDSGSNLFFNEGDIIGFVIEIEPIVGKDSNLEKNLTLFFNNEMPPGSYLQFLLVAGHHIEKKLDAWRGMRNTGNQMLRKLTFYRQWFIKKKALDFSASDGRMGKDFRIYVSFSKKIDNSKKQLAEIHNFQDKLLRKFQSLKLSPRFLNAQELIYLANEILEVKMTPPSAKKYSPLNLISEQITTPLSSMTVTDGHLEFSDSKMVSKCFYPSSYPEEFSLPEMIALLGSESDSGLPARLILSYTVANDVGLNKTLNVLKRGRDVIAASEQFYSRNDYTVKKQAQEWKEIFDKHKSGQKFLHESMQIMISCPERNLGVAEESLISLYNSMDWILKENKNLQLPSMLSMLPVQQALYFDTLKYFKLTRLALSGEIVAKLPVQGEWKGVSQSGVLFQGRRGELFNWNPFVRLASGNYNVAVMAPSGSGKSVLLQELATSMLAQNTSVFVLDIGGSYQNICELLGGETFRFNNQSLISLNPFASMIVSREADIGSNVENNAEDLIEFLNVGNFRVTKDSIIYGKSILSAMCGMKGDARKEALIEKAISEGISLYGSDLDITKLASIMSGTDFENGSGYELAQTLYPYTEKGVHGRFFKSGKIASFKESFTLFEFEEVKNDPVLLSVILQVILMQITQQFLVGDRSKQFMLIVDEAWMILEHSASFLEAFARTVRKYGGSLVICVQNFNDFKKTAERRSILENSTWTIMLKQDEKGLGAFKSDDEFNGMSGLIESISLSPGKYAEALLFTSGLKIIGRLILDPYSLALYSTDAKDYRFLQQRKKEGFSKDEAIRELAAKFGELPEVSDAEI